MTSSESDARPLLPMRNENSAWSSRADRLTASSRCRADVRWRSFFGSDGHEAQVSLERLEVFTRVAYHGREGDATSCEPRISCEREPLPAISHDGDAAEHGDHNTDLDDRRLTARVGGEEWTTDRDRAPRGMSNRYAQMRERAAIRPPAHEAPDQSGAPVVAERIDGLPRAAAWFVENFALAKVGASSGIKHGTVRNVSTPHVRSASIQTFTQTIGHPTSWSRVTPSRLAALSSHSPTVGPPRSDRCSAGCSPSEDQGGPP